MNKKIPIDTATFHAGCMAILILAALSCVSPGNKEGNESSVSPLAPASAQTELDGQKTAPVAQEPSKLENTDPVVSVPLSTKTEPKKKKAAQPKKQTSQSSIGTSSPAPSPANNAQAKNPVTAVPPVKSGKSACGADLAPENLSRQDVYKNRPYQAGESAEYDVSYMGIHAGFGNIDVESPIKYDGNWHQVFSGNASTGEWYEKIFIVKDKIRSISRPWDFGAGQFYIEQNEGSFFGRRYRQKKWINYDHNTCKAFEKTEDRNKKIKNDELPLEPGADDALSALFELRSSTLVLGASQRILVYTSEKNWFLEARVLAIETVTVPAGIFKAAKLELKTYLGQELQQKGDVHIWLASEHEARPLVKVEAEIKIGKVSIVLKKFTPGRS